MAEKNDRNPLPTDFFAGTGLDETWSLVRTQVLERLRDENSSGENMLDLIMLERTSHIYAILRQHEAAAISEDDDRFSRMLPATLYKDMMKMLVAMIESLRAQRDKDFVIEEARREVVHAVVTSMKDAIKVLPPSEQKTVMTRVKELVGGLE